MMMVLVGTAGGTGRYDSFVTTFVKGGVVRLTFTTPSTALG